MDRKNLISIGKLSEITGVHVQSLRYYEKIGILIPSYTDQNSRYRYYSFSQIKIVEAIQYCVELDIPLKFFADFISEDQNQIDYEKLICYGRQLAFEKISAIKAKMSFFEDLNREMQHSETCSEDTPIIDYLPSRTFFTQPYHGTQSDSQFFTMIVHLLEEIRANSWQTSYDTGLFSLFRPDSQEHFAYVNIRNANAEILQHPQVFHIPGGNFICRKRGESNILEVPELYPEQFSLPYDKLVIETELFTGKFHYRKPLYEIQCSLPDLD